MSHQLEDDSALEELLKQQLDIMKPAQPLAPPTTGERRVTVRSAPRTNHVNSSQATAIETMPKTSALNKDLNAAFSDDSHLLGVQQTQSGPPIIKLASWYNSNPDSTLIRSKLPAQNSTKGRAPSLTSYHPVKSSTLSECGNRVSTGDVLSSVNKLIEVTLKEDRLQDLSKQSLIQLILSQIHPAIEYLRELASNYPADQNISLKEELELEKSKILSMEVQWSEKMKTAESTWTRLNKQLETRLHNNERELIQMREDHKVMAERIEEEHRRELIKLKENYQARLVEEKQQSEDALKRCREFHQIELESKLKVNYDLARMDAILMEWNKMIESVTSKFEFQLKFVDESLRKQTLEISDTSLDLAEKTKLLVAHFERYETQNTRLADLANQINELLPRFSYFQAENESIAKNLSFQVLEFQRRHEQLVAKEGELVKLRNELAHDREKLNEGKYELGLGANKLVYKEERLDELTHSNEEEARMLKEDRCRLSEREAHLEAARTSLNLKSGQLKHQNYDLHLVRKRLTEKEEDLAKLDMHLIEERNSILELQCQVKRDEMNLSKLRCRARKEFCQLRRLQESLVCTLCLDRLFKRSGQGLEKVSQRESKWHGLTVINLTGRQVCEEAKSEARCLAEQGELVSKMSSQMEFEEAQLKTESRLMELLSKR